MIGMKMFKTVAPPLRRNLHQQVNMHAWSEDNIPFIIHLIGECVLYIPHAAKDIHAVGLGEVNRRS